MSVKVAVTAGVAAGAFTAITLMALTAIRPFSVPFNDIIERATFRFCPLYVLIFSNSVKSWPALIAIVILSNAILYGIAFGIIAAIVYLFRRIVGGWPTSKIK